MSKPKMIYAGTDGEAYPKWDLPVASLVEMEKAKKVLDQGEYASSTEVDNALHSPFTSDFQEPLKYFNDVVLAGESAAAPMTSQDFPLIQNVTMAGQVIVNQQTQFPLLGAVNVENTTDLIFRRYNAEGFEIDAIVGELGTTEPRKMKFSKTEYYTRKSGGEIQWSDEHEMNNYLINPLQLARGQFTIGADKVKNDKTVAALALFTEVEGADASVIGGNGRSTNNPYPFFAAVRKTINYTNTGNLNQGAMNSNTLYALLNNDFVKGLQNTQGLVGQEGASVQLPGIPNISFVIDESLTDGNVYLWDKAAAMVRIQGPVRTEQYRLVREGGNGLVYRDWNDIQVRDLTKARYISGFL